MPSLTIYRQWFMPEDVWEGDINYRRTECETLEFDSEDWDSVVEWALYELQGMGYFEYSSYPFQSGGWYSATESTWDGAYTGEQIDISVHPKGFTEAQERELYDTL